MRKVIVSLLLAMALTVAVMTPALADKGGQPNDNASWGQAVGDNTPMGDIASHDHEGKKDSPPRWGPGGIRENDGLLPPTPPPVF